MSRDEKPKLGDPEYGVEEFVAETSGGSLRWIATFLAVLSVGLLIATFNGWVTPELYWPIHLSGTSAYVAVYISVLVWVSLAVINWLIWLRDRDAA